MALMKTVMGLMSIEGDSILEVCELMGSLFWE